MNYLLLVKFLIYGIISVPAFDFFSYDQNQIVSLSSKPYAKLNSGTTVKTSIDFLIKKGYHIQADTVKDNNLIPSALTFEKVEGFEIKIIFPDYKEFLLKGTEETLLVFDNDMSVTVEISTIKSLGQGTYMLPGELKYQACDSVRCLFPRTLNIEIMVAVDSK